MKALEILTKTRSQITDDHQFANMYDEAIEELDGIKEIQEVIERECCLLRDKLTKSQAYIKYLEEQLRNKQEDGWMNK